MRSVSIKEVVVRCKAEWCHIEIEEAIETERIIGILPPCKMWSSKILLKKWSTNLKYELK